MLSTCFSLEIPAKQTANITYVNKLILAFILVTPCSAYAYDQYYKSGVKWSEQIELKSNVSVWSMSKLSKYDVNLMHKIYDLTEKLFFSYFDLKPNQCNLGHLKIKFVKNHYDLSNHKYFPNEAEYADHPSQGTKIIFGRYYRITNVRCTEVTI